MISTTKVEYHADIALCGYLVRDDRVAGPRPGVLVFHEGDGLGENIMDRAARLGAMGYIAFVADLYGIDHSDRDLAISLYYRLKADSRLLRARARAALDAIADQPDVVASKLAAIGFCFGGTTALELARSGAPVRLAVCFHGELGALQPGAGQPITSRFLVCAGSEDPLVTAADRAGFEDEMRAAGSGWQINLYGGAAHSFTNPRIDERNMPGFAYHKEADERSWSAMKKALSDVFA